MAINIHTPPYDQGEFVKVQELQIGDWIVVPVDEDWTNTYRVIELRHAKAFEVRITLRVEGDDPRLFFMPYGSLIERVPA